MTTINELVDYIVQYRETTPTSTWSSPPLYLNSFDTHQELIKAINVEAGELLELVTFKDCTASVIAPELADVLIYCFALADYLELDIETIVKNKIEFNTQRGREYDIHR